MRTHLHILHANVSSVDDRNIILNGLVWAREIVGVRVDQLSDLLNFQRAAVKNGACI